MGENLGTIDASAYLIAPREITRCSNASASSGSTPKTGRPFNNIHVFPEQTAYELLRPVVLFGDPAIQRAQETGEPRTSLERKADAFDEQGMISFFASRLRKQPQETARSLPPDMRQLIVDLRVEMPNMSIREIAEICDTRFQTIHNEPPLGENVATPGLAVEWVQWKHILALHVREEIVSEQDCSQSLRTEALSES